MKIEQIDEILRQNNVWSVYEGEPIYLHVAIKTILKLERNRLAEELKKMPLNDTANSIAIWIREQE